MCVASCRLPTPTTQTRSTGSGSPSSCTLGEGRGMLGGSGSACKGVCALAPRLLHILPTLILHATFLRDMERHLGWLRTTIIYVGSGIFGNLMSAIVTPYYPTVGRLLSTPRHTQKHLQTLPFTPLPFPSRPLHSPPVPSHPLPLLSPSPSSPALSLPSPPLLSLPPPLLHRRAHTAA